jgi:quinol monooxygenase YgiN
VANYAQWRSRADFEAMLQNAEARVYMEKVAKLASFEPYLYEVVYSDTTSSLIEP